MRVNYAKIISMEISNSHENFLNLNNNHITYGDEYRNVACDYFVL